jgi:hypothetical protein
MDPTHNSGESDEDVVLCESIRRNEPSECRISFHPNSRCWPDNVARTVGAALLDNTSVTSIILSLSGARASHDNGMTHVDLTNSSLLQYFFPPQRHCKRLKYTLVSIGQPLF